MKKFTKSLLILSLLLTSSLVYSMSENDWKAYYQDNKVKISYKYQNCDFQDQFNQEFVVFKIENLSTNAISLECDAKIWYDESCINCEQDIPEFRKEIRIEPGQVLESNCRENTTLTIFSKFTEELDAMPGVDKIVKLTKFELENLKITDE